MIGYAKNKYKNYSIDFRVCDITDLPSEWKDKFNAIVSITVFQHLHFKKAKKALLAFSHCINKNGIIRIDFQLNRESGFDPDLRYIESYESIDDINKKLDFKNLGFELLDSAIWELPVGKNTFHRPVSFKFCDLYLKKV